MVSKILLDKYLSEAVFFGAMGCAAAMAFSGFEAAYGTAKASVGISSLTVIDQSKLMQSIIPVVIVVEPSELKLWERSHSFARRCHGPQMRERRREKT